MYLCVFVEFDNAKLGKADCESSSVQNKIPIGSNVVLLERKISNIDYRQFPKEMLFEKGGILALSSLFLPANKRPYHFVCSRTPVWRQKKVRLTGKKKPTVFGCRKSYRCPKEFTTKIQLNKQLTFPMFRKTLSEDAMRIDSSTDHWEAKDSCQSQHVI